MSDGTQEEIQTIKNPLCVLEVICCVWWDRILDISDGFYNTSNCHGHFNIGPIQKMGINGPFWSIGFINMTQGWNEFKKKLIKKDRPVLVELDGFGLEPNICTAFFNCTSPEDLADEFRVRLILES